MLMILTSRNSACNSLLRGEAAMECGSAAVRRSRRRSVRQTTAKTRSASNEEQLEGWGGLV